MDEVPLEHVIWDSLFNTAFVLGLVFNALVFLIICCFKDLRSMPNIYILNITLADTMLIILNGYPSYQTLRDPFYAQSNLSCKLLHFSGAFTATASLLNLCIMTLVRSLKVVYNIDLSTFKHFLAISTTWLISFGCGSFGAIYATNYVSPNERTYCSVKMEKKVEFTYNYLMVLIGFVIPIICLVVTSFKTGKVLNKPIVGEPTPQQIQTKQKMKRAAKVFWAVTVYCIISWGPYQAYFVVGSHIKHKLVDYSHIVQNVYLTIFLIVILQSVLNPFVFFVLDQTFHKSVKSMMSSFKKCLPFVRQDQTQEKTSQEKVKIILNPFEVSVHRELHTFP